MTTKKESPDTEDKPEDSPKPFPLPIIQEGAEDIEEEMRELFDEDRVKHQQGSTEPERD